MKKIKGMTFAPFARRGDLEGNEVQKSLQTMIKNTGSNTVILAPAGIQQTSHSTKIDWNSNLTASDEELVALINYAHSLGVQVFLKPTANTANGEWRAFISFFENDVPCEPKWSDWFRSYTAFQLHYARIAEETGCEMFIAGCMSTKGSAAVPNNWEIEGELSLEEQRRWYEKAIHAISRRDWVEGTVFWSWDRILYSKEQAQGHRFYEVYEKPAEKVIAEYFHSL